MAHQIMNCSILFQASIWMPIIADRVWQSFNMNALKYIRIIYSVVDKRFLKNAFVSFVGDLCDRCVSRIILPPVSVFKSSASICVEIKVQGLTVWSYCSILLTLMRLWYQFHACTERNIVLCILSRSFPFEGYLLHLLISITSQFKCKQRREDRDWE